MEIHYLKHKDIDFAKWDDSIRKSENGLIYGLSWFLNIVSPNWEALIAGDYETVMPLAIKKKWGLRYIFKPFFAQFYGIFFTNKLNPEIIESFIEVAATKVQFLDIWLNPGNYFPELLLGAKRNTQQLNISNSYEEISARYSRSNKNNLKKARKEGFELRREQNGDIEIQLLRGMYSRKNVEGFKEEDFRNLSKVYTYSIINPDIKTEFYTLYKEDSPCAAAVILEWNKRAVIYHAANDIGRKTRAMFVLVDEYLKEHAGQDLIFDFAGSNIPGVAEWNIGFGAENLNYYAVRINNLPIPLKWLKR